MKRRGENMQLRPDEVEALNEASDDGEEEGGGTFQRADDAVLAQRRRVKIRRPGGSQDTSAAPSFTTVPVSNPFAGFSGLSSAGIAGSSTAGSAPSAPSISATPVSNPFAGFTGLAPSKPLTTDISAVKPSFSFTTATPSTAPPAALSKPSGTSSAASVSAAPGSAAAKMEALNKALFEWMKTQMKDHALSIWKDGLLDYIKYANEISEAADKETISSSDSSSSKSIGTSAVPSSAASTHSLPSFGASKVSESGGSEASKPPSMSFSFSSNPPTVSAAPKDAPKPNFSFSIPTAAPAPTEAPKASFSFSLAPAATPSAGSSAPASTGFSFSLPSGGTPFGITPAPLAFAKPAVASAEGGEEEGEGGDEEAAPLLEPEKVFRNENDTDQVLHEAACKLFRFNKSNNEWNESGKGTFKVTQDADTKKRRMLIRNMTGKVTMNAAFYSGMKFSQVGKNGVRFMAVVDESGEPKLLMIKVKPDEVAKTLKVLEESASAVA